MKKRGLLMILSLATAPLSAQAQSTLRIVMGAPYNDAGGNLAGRAYYWDGTTSTTLTGESADDRFGTSVAVGNIAIGNSIPEIAIGAPSYDAGSGAVGRVYVFTDTDSTPDVILTGTQVGAGFGSIIAYAGDVNGDGYGDLAVAAPSYDGAFTNAGRVYIYYGGTTFNNVHDVTLDGIQANESFGVGLVGDADIDHDGYDDLAIGAPYYDFTLISTIVDAGRVLVYRGGPTFPSAGTWSLVSALAGGYYGYSVAMGELNADDYEDVLVGAPGVDVSGSTDVGRAYAYFGGNPFARSISGTLTGEAANDRFGHAVTVANFNVDGYEDAVVGAPNNDAGGSSAGRVYVFNGAAGSTLNNVADTTITGSAGDTLGNTLASSNGESIIAGAMSYSSSKGRVFVYDPGDTTADLTFTGEATLDGLGASVAGN